MKTYPVSPHSKESLERIGEKILAQFDGKHLQRPSKLDVEKLIDPFLKKTYDWSLDIQDDLPADVLGISDPKRKAIRLPQSSYDRLVNGDGRSRFTGCHEFSHVVLHRDQMSERMVTFQGSNEYLYRADRTSIRPFENPEWQADYLAGVLLMPRSAVFQLVDKYEQNVVNAMMEILGVSQQAAEVRLSKLRIF